MAEKVLITLEMVLNSSKCPRLLHMTAPVALRCPGCAWVVGHVLRKGRAPIREVVYCACVKLQTRQPRCDCAHGGNNKVTWHSRRDTFAICTKRVTYHRFIVASR